MKKNLDKNHFLYDRNDPKNSSLMIQYSIMDRKV